MNRSPDYEEKSKLIAELCDNDVALKEARAEIYEALTESVQIIKQLRSSDDDNIKLKSCKEHLLLAGLYVEKHEHSGSVKFEPLKISRGDDE